MIHKARSWSANAACSNCAPPRWVVYAKSPLAGAAAVPDYLSRYTHRTAIGHERIVAVRDDGVRLRVRTDHDGGKKVRRTKAMPRHPLQTINRRRCAEQ